MAYKDTLSKVIKNSGLSLREIAQRSCAMGIDITASYISQIQNGKLPPPSEEISKTIAIICKSDPVALIFEGYLEKAPETVQYYFISMSEANRQLLEIVMPKFNFGLDDDKLKEYVEQNNIVVNLSHSVSYLHKLQRHFKIKPKINLIDTQDENMLNKYEIDVNDFVFMEDDSMEPLIPKHSYLRYKSYRGNEPKDSDVVIFKLVGDEKTYVRRYYDHKDMILFIPENKNHGVIKVENKGKFMILGEVYSYTANINQKTN